MHEREEIKDKKKEEKDGEKSFFLSLSVSAAAVTPKVFEGILFVDICFTWSDFVPYFFGLYRDSVRIGILLPTCSLGDLTTATL